MGSNRLFDFEIDGQEYRYVKDRKSASGKTWHVYRSECAICREPIEVVGLGASMVVGRRCKKHRARGAAVGSNAEARKIKAQGWLVVEGSVLDRLRKARAATTSGRPRSDPRPVEKAKAEPTPRKRKVAAPTKQALAAARAEKVRRRKVRFVEKSARV